MQLFCDNCTVLVADSNLHPSCKAYCAAHNRQCVYAAEEINDTCEAEPKYPDTDGCDVSLRGFTSNYLCTCSENPGNLSSKCWIYKQTKNRNETGSNLSLGTRLTVLSECLGHKRCYDTTPGRCLERNNALLKKCFSK